MNFCRRYLIILFFISLLAVPIYWLVKGNDGPHFSIIEQRNLSDFPAFGKTSLREVVDALSRFRTNQAMNLVLPNFSEGEYQITLQNAAADQFPFRLMGIKNTKAAERAVIALTYAFLPDQIIPTDMHSGFYVTRDQSQILFPPDTYDDSVENAIDQRIQNYEQLIRDYPSINFYVLELQRLANSESHPLNPYFFNSDQSQALTYFEAKKPINLQVSVLPIDQFSDHLKYYYATDHHLSLEGLGESYLLLHQMLAQNYPQITAPLLLDKKITFDKALMLGSLARKSLFPIKGDLFQAYDLDLPPYIVFLEGGIYPLQQKQEDLINHYSTKPFQEYYGQFFDLQNSIYQFQFTNESDRNLLIIGSSFVRGVVPMIASHYHNTYYIDLRQNTLNLGEFLRDYPVDDVVVFGDNPVTFTDPAWAINP